ncbi:MAG: polyisoprenoid-binding protein [Chitinophagaceae bacterium]|nr:MAG: polyisoprenoid-binding protein [Chitinophagaceae bacterium]
MKKLFLAAAIALSTSGLFAQTTWNVDPAHSNVRFTVSHLVVSEVEGTFKKFNGSLVSSRPDLTDAKINFTVDVNSINTDNEGRDKHLKGDDFFNADNYPQMTFVGTSFRKLSGNQYELKGNLTIRNVTRPATFKVTYGGTVKDPWGNIKAGFKASGSINRFDYGLKWNTLTEAGGAVVGKDIAIDLKLEFAQAK